MQLYAAVEREKPQAYETPDELLLLQALFHVWDAARSNTAVKRMFT